MKKTISAMAALLVFASCSDNTVKDEKTTDANIPSVGARSTPPTSYPGFISIDSANKMISSYINSINYPSNDSDLCSVTFDAEELRALLDSPSVTRVQIKLAHTLSYINQGKQNIPAGYKSGALTFLISGVNNAGNTVLYNNMILNFARPCPNSCPSGTAGVPLY